MRKMKFTLVAGTALATTFSTPAFAQDGTPYIEDIVVTAQKKSQAEKAQDVPIALTSVSGDRLQEMNVRTLTDLGSIAPNVSLETNGAARGTAVFTIRGQGANASIPSVEPTVGLFVNGVYMGINMGVVTDMFDVESIEVLRGPQGTLFGRNVTSGAVLIQTRRPTGAFGASGELRLESGPQVTAAATVEAPLGDRVAAKLTGYYSYDQGWFHNSYLNQDTGGGTTYFVRPTVVLKPTDTIEQTFIFEHGDMTGTVAPYRNRYLNPKFDITQGDNGSQSNRWNSFVSETNIDVGLGDGVITNIFGWRNYRQAIFNADLDGTPQVMFHQDWKLEQEQVSNELRYAGNFLDGKWNLTLGGYYFHQNLLSVEKRDLGPPVSPTPSTISSGGKVNHSSYAVFMQNNIKLSDKINLTAGLRYSYEKKAALVARFSAALPCDVPTMVCDFTVPGSIDGDRSWKSLSPKVGIDIKVTPDFMVYASYSGAERSGGFNTRISSAFDPGEFDAEHTQNFEIGFKSDLFDRKLRFNATAFLNNVSDMQRQSYVPTTTGTAQILDNSADARIWGLEGEILFAPTRSLRIGLSGGYTHGKYTDVKKDLNNDRVINEIDYGYEIPRLARWSANASIGYEVPVSEKDKLKADVSFGYISRAWLNETNTVPLVARKKLNANLTYELDDGKLAFSIYGNNLLNKEYNDGGSPLVVGVSYLWPIQKGRVYGASMRFNF